MTLIAFAAAMLLLAQAGPVPDVAARDSAPPELGRTIILRGLDKVTGRLSTIEAPAGERVRFGTLRIEAKTCEKTPPEEPPERTAFLEIDNIPAAGGPPTRVFTGWMFASSPAVNALEHPVYDVWLIDCKIADPEASAGKR
ncbi:MAG: DUF2155 domain-containing protein [Pseudomonadota bacterium]